MEDTKCNGWRNWETWNTRLMYEEVFQSIANEDCYKSLESLSEAFENLVFELELENQKLTLLQTSAISDFLGKVDWREIAESFVD